LPANALEGDLVMGNSLWMEGVRHIRWVLPMAAVSRLKMLPKRPFFPEIEIIPVHSLAELYAHLTGLVT
jgi:hypothetical protein